MKNPVASLARSVVRWFHRISPERIRQSRDSHGAAGPSSSPALSPEEFRRMLAETLANDPELARQMLQPLLGTVIPIVAGACDVPATDVAPGVFGTECSVGNYSFQAGANVGFGTSTPTNQIQVAAAGPSPITMTRRGSGSGSAELWALGIQAVVSDTLLLGQSSSAYSTGGTIQWIGNSNAFLYFNSGQQFRIGAGTGTTPWLTIAGSTGNIGIANASPSEKLDVVGNAKVSGNLTVDTSTLVVDAANDRVGIGTASPAEKLDVAGNAKVSGNLTVDTNVLFVDATGNKVGVGTATPGKELDVVGEARVSGNLTVDTNTLVVDASNNRVGIGTASPEVRLDVQQVFSSTPPCTPPCAFPVTRIYVEGGVGNNSDFWGEVGMYLTVRDHANVTSSNKGVLYGLNIDMYPNVNRDEVPADDVAALVVSNSGAGKGTDCIYVNNGTGITAAGDPEWINILQIDAPSDNGIRFVSTESTASMKYAIKMDELMLKSGGAGILLRNNMPIASIKAGAGTPPTLPDDQVLILTLDSNDNLVHRAGSQSAASHEFRVKDGSDTVLGVLDSGISSSETSLWLRRNLSGTLTLQRVTMGDPNSGGSGYRVLRVPN